MGKKFTDVPRNDLIDFNAWDKTYQVILKVQQLDFTDWWVQCKKPDGDICVKAEDRQKWGERNSFKNETSDRHILLPFTACTDKDVQKIYHMDLVEYGENKELGLIDKLNGVPVIRFLDDQYLT